MDAKSKADFINSVASETNVPCPKCGANNKAGSKFCISCGAEISAPKAAANNAPAFETAQEVTAKDTKYRDPNNVFAKGLPDWSIEPPQVMVRRH